MWMIPESLQSAPESEALSSDFELSCPMPDLWVSVKGKPVQRPPGWRGWKTRPWSRLLFSAAIWQTSRVDSFVDAWTSSLRDSPVSPTVRQGSNAETTTTGPSGPHSATSSSPVPPPWCSLRTSQLSLLPDTLPAPENGYPAWVSRSKIRSLSVRKMLVQRIAESGYSSSPTWGTPNAGDDASTGKPRPSRGGRQTEYLSRQAIVWPTPTAQHHNDGGTWEAHVERGKRLKDQGYNPPSAPLALKARNWPTPRTSDRNGGTVGTNSADRGQLCGVAEQFHLPGLKPSTSGQPSSNSSPSGRPRLNPLFVEWLMGWPEGWTDSDPLDAATVSDWRATVFTLYRQLLPSPYSPSGQD